MTQMNRDPAFRLSIFPAASSITFLSILELISFGKKRYFLDPPNYWSSDCTLISNMARIMEDSGSGFCTFLRSIELIAGLI
jgi:hypothetical protein